jgi:hypothetical protein
MAAITLDLEWEQNAVWALDLEAYDPLPDDPTQPDLAAPHPLEGWTATMQVRDKAGSPDPPIIVLDEASGRITLDATGIHLRLTAAETRDLTFRVAHYDLRLVPPTGDDGAEYWLRGTIRLQKAVTV